MGNEVVNTGVAVPATGTETKTKRARGLVNQRYARELTVAFDVAQAALNPGRAAALSAREIGGAWVNELLGDIEEAQSKAAEAVSNTTAHRNATAAEKQAAKALEAGLKEAQKAAKQKYARSNRIALADYFVGRKLNGSRPNLAQTSQTILNRLGNDKLPGFTAAKLKSLAGQRDVWRDAQTTQAEAEAAAMLSRAELKVMLKGIKDRKIAVQLAADAEWPYGDEENAGTRKEFKLPTKRSLTA